MAHSRGKQKGAFQLSLGFVIGVIFAIVLLSLAIIWIQNLMASMGGLTDDLMQEGGIKIRDAFKDTSTKFMVYPSEWSMERGKKLMLVAGIVNRATDSMSHTYVIKVFPQLPATLDWVNIFEYNVPLNTEFGGVVEFPITVTPPANIAAGTYVFRIAACEGRTYENCRLEDMNYGTPQYLRLTLE